MKLRFLAVQTYRCSLPMKSRKGLALDAPVIPATHSGHVHDVTELHCWAQNGSLRVTFSCFRDFQTSVLNKRESACFRDFQTSVLNKQDQKSSCFRDFQTSVLSKRERKSSCFRDFQTSVLNKQDAQNRVKTAVYLFSFSFYDYSV